jgi:hypothetical protein
MKKSMILFGLLAVLVPFAVMGSEASPYLVGEWGLNDTFQDGTTPVTIVDTSLTFVNPTNKTQVLEYAFFDDTGGFCGCDRDFPGPNSITRYTMSAENTGGMFICNGTTKPLQTHGAVKSIVFDRGTRGGIAVGTAMTLGFQTNFFAGGRTESDMKSIPNSGSIMTEMKAIHQQCVDFCTANPTICPALP